ncbi:MAG TPA: glycoside hydrolase family 38 C-terminal domain-containing protein [Clostridia bacterium]|jgi:alpha-mannosidase|nr:glycoside hydrolase family 38 C-terminal domain-containing protein [Clostridia bacterium]
MVEKILIHPTHITRLLEIRKRVYTPVADLEVTGCKSDEPIKYSDLDKQQFVPMKKGEEWGGKFGCCWFHVKGEVPAKCKGKHVVAILNFNGEGAIYDKGRVIQGITPILSFVEAAQPRVGKQIAEITSDAQGGEKVDWYIDCGNNGINGNFVLKPKVKTACIAVVNDAALRYYYDYLAVFLLTTTYGENKLLDKERKAELEELLSRSYRCFAAKDYAFADNTIKIAYEKDKNYNSTIYTAIGHAHLDLGWLWPVRETKRKAIRTLATALKNLDRYPDYVFGASQAQMFEWIKQEQPELYERIKEYVAKGRIEIQGNMWTECDCNLPSGESLIRQFLYGDRFFIGEMGVRSRMVWLPDVFGYPATLPQIIKGVGKDYFMTIKLSWNTYNKFPLQSFVWKGADGSEIIAHIAPEGNYNSDATPLNITKAEKLNVNKETGMALLIFGAGDGGGGPGEGHLEMLERVKKLNGINVVKEGRAQGFFEELKKQELKKYTGELYLEKHQGTYTSQAANKLYNRLMERALHNVEWLKAVSGNNENLDEIWKETLLNQFHDIIPGSSINRVYKESRASYEKMYRALCETEDGILNSLSDKEGLTAINPTSFTRKDYIKHNGNWYKALCMPYSSAPLTLWDEERKLATGEDYIENEYLKVKFDSDGVIVSFFDKAKNREYSKRGLNRLVVYKDPKMYYNAWDIKGTYTKHAPSPLTLVSSRSYVDGPDVVMENSYVYNDSTVTQKVILRDRLLNFDTKADWHEKHKMLRAEFYPRIYGDKVNCDIQFGSIDRSTKNDTSVEKAQYEICAHKYVAVNDDKGYFALINDCKYGHRVKEGVISLNLIRSPKYPDPECDMGAHSFGYAVKGCESMKEVVENAYLYNNPLIVVEKDVRIEPIVDINNENVIVETIKPSEDGEGIVVRLYERYGSNETVIIKPNFAFSGIFECNLLEEDRKETDATVILTPHQIKTIYIRK